MFERGVHPYTVLNITSSSKGGANNIISLSPINHHVYLERLLQTLKEPFVNAAFGFVVGFLFGARKDISEVGFYFLALGNRLELLYIDVDLNHRDLCFVDEISLMNVVQTLQLAVEPIHDLVDFLFFH